MTPEVELKLDIASEDADRLASSGLFAGAPSVVDLRSVYFDTPQDDLAGAGFSLRVRHLAQTRIQTVKATGARSLGLFVRPEWERPIDGDRPVLDLADPLRALFRDKVDDLRPIFQSRVERRTWIVDRENAIIEVVLDRGEIDAGERLSPVCEIELELKSGSAQALFDLARDIDRITPVAPSVLSKAERGYRLLGPKAAAVKSEPIDLDPEVSTARAFTAIAGACLRQFRLNEAGVAVNDGEAVHQARIALRRLRSAFAIFKPLLAGPDLDRLVAEVKWLAGALGEVRDLDVLTPRLDGSDLRSRVRDARDAAARDLATALGSLRKRTLMLDLVEWLATGSWLSAADRAELREEPAADFARGALDRYRRKVKKGGRDLEDLSDEMRHQVRKDAKKLRYASEFFAPLFAGKKSRKRRHKRFVELLGTLQDELGTLNDLASVQSTLQRIGLATEAQAADLLASGADRSDRLASAAEAYDTFTDAKRFWR